MKPRAANTIDVSSPAPLDDEWLDFFHSDGKPVDYWDIIHSSCPGRLLRLAEETVVIRRMSIS
ncbi:MAG: hypothetical protein LUQ04_10610 [Methanoregula sp.]|nr:hypothetical protein [Methanoregula sp.]